jgi:hypothetical protein
MTRRRSYRPKLRDGELRVYWGKLPHENPDVIYAHQGDHSMRSDIRMVRHHLAVPQPDPLVKPFFSKMNPSLLQELEARGYDITTLRFSIMKKPSPPEEVG